MVKCEICGKEFRHISNSHLEKHGMTPQQYKERHPSTPLRCFVGVECRVCGKQLRKITHSHLRTHDMTLAEYYAKYPQNATTQYRNQLAHDESELVTCLVCGMRMKTANATHLKKHGMTTRDYMEKFPGAEMRSAIVRQRQSEVSKEICKTTILTPEAKAKSAEATSQRSLEMWESDRDAIIGKQNRGKRTSQKYSDSHGRQLRRYLASPEGKANSSRTGAMVLQKYPRMLKGRYSVPTEYKGIQFRSMSEAKMAEILDLLDISYEYEKRIIKLVAGGYERSHTPDFYLPDFGIYLEVKGYMTEKAQMFHEAAVSQGFNYVICTTSLIRRTISTAKTFAQTPGNRSREKGVDCWNILKSCAATAWPETVSANAGKEPGIHGQSAAKPLNPEGHEGSSEAKLSPPATMQDDDMVQTTNPTWAACESMCSRESQILRYRSDHELRILDHR